MMDFHLLESRQPRSAYKQLLKSQVQGFVKPYHTPGESSSLDTPGGRVRGKNPEWDKAFGLLFNVAKRMQVSAATYNLATKVLRIKMNGTQEETFVKEFVKSPELVRELLRQSKEKTWTNTRDVSAIGLGAGTLTSKIDPSIAAQVDLQGADPLSRKEFLGTRSHTALAIEKAVDTNKPRNLQDPMVVYSGVSANAEIEPYYILTKLHRDHEERDTEHGVYELVVPSAFDFRNKAPGTVDRASSRAYSGGFDYSRKTPLAASRGRSYTGPSSFGPTTRLNTKIHGTVGENAPFKKFYRTGTLSVIHVERTSLTFEEVVTKFMKKAWDIAKLFYEQNERLKKAKKDLAQAHTHPSTTPEDIDALRAEVFVYTTLLSGKIPPRRFAAAFKSSQHWAKISQEMGDAVTWYTWLLAAESAYGVLLLERQHIRPVAPQNKEFTVNMPGRRPIRQRTKAVNNLDMGRKSSGWNRELLDSLGIARHIGDPETEITRIIQNLAHTRIKISDVWVIASAAYVKTHGFHIAPSEITDFIQNAVKHTRHHPRELHLLGKKGGVLKLETNKTMNIVGHLTKLGTSREVMLVNARSWLKFFDSPKHGGQRLVHTVAGPVIKDPIVLRVGDSPGVTINRAFSLTQAKHQNQVGRDIRANRLATRARAISISQAISKPGISGSEIHHSSGVTQGTSHRTRIITMKKYSPLAPGEVRNTSSGGKALLSPRTAGTLERLRSLNAANQEGREQAAIAGKVQYHSPGISQALATHPGPVVRTLRDNPNAGPPKSGLTPSEIEARVNKRLPDRSVIASRQLDSPMYQPTYNKDQDREDVTLAPGITKREFSFDKSNPEFIKRERDISDTRKKIAALRKSRSK